jgi:hypothetical protein
VPGDANADGRVDVSDAVFLERHLFAGGAGPPCEAAVNAFAETPIESGDGFAILGHLFQGAGLPEAQDDACADAIALSEPDPARISFVVEAEGPTATVAIRSRDVPVQAWSFGLSTDGCTATGATTTGTVAADAFDGGTRRLGYDATRVVDGGAVTAVVLSWHEDVVIDAGEEPVPVLRVELDGAGKCTLAITDGLEVHGRAVDVAVTSGGRTFVPEAVDAKVKL